MSKYALRPCFAHGKMWKIDVNEKKVTRQDIKLAESLTQTWKIRVRVETDRRICSTLYYVHSLSLQRTLHSEWCILHIYWNTRTRESIRRIDEIRKTVWLGEQHRAAQRESRYSHSFAHIVRLLFDLFMPREQYMKLYGNTLIKGTWNDSNASLLPDLSLESWKPACAWFNVSSQCFNEKSISPPRKVLENKKCKSPKDETVSSRPSSTRKQKKTKLRQRLWFSFEITIFRSLYWRYSSFSLG